MAKTFDKELGAKLLKKKKGYCEVKLNIKPWHLNNGGIVHGGVIAALCDIALAGAVGTSLKKEEWCVTAELHLNFLRPAFGGEPVISYGKLVKKGNTLAFVEGGVMSKTNGLIARASGIWAIKSRPSKKIKKAKSLG